MKKFKVLTIGILLAGMLIGCGKSEKGAAAGKTATATKKILNIADNAELSSMDSTLVTDTVSFNAISATTEGLYQLDKNGNVIPGMAESTEVSEDGKIYTFHLRDAKWSNGQPVTANDFVFAWKRLVDPKTAAEYSYMADIASIKNVKAIEKGEKSVSELGIAAIDDKTLKVELEVPIPFFKSLMAFPSFFPIREDFYKKFGDQYGLTPESVLANGPFKMKTWDQGGDYTIEKNKLYYDADKVKIDGLNFQVIKDEQSSVIAFEQGDIDFVKLNGELAEMYKGSPEFRNIPDGGLAYIAVNEKVPGLENADLRKAIALSFDKEQIAEKILKNGSIAANFAVTKDLATGPDGKDFRDGTPEYLVQDKVKAREYYEKAKKELGRDKFTYEFLFNDTESNKEIAEFLKSELETNLPGMIIELRQVPFKARVQMVHASQFELGFTAWGPDYADPMTYLDMWVTDAGNNYGFWSNKEYDQLIYDASKGIYVNDPAARWEAMKKAEAICLNDAGIIPIYQKGAVGMIKKGVSGIEFHAVGVNTIFKNAVKE